MAILISERGVAQLMLAPFSYTNYVAFFGIFRICIRPFSVLWRYFTAKGDYPEHFMVRTPLGPLALHLYQHADMLTLNEIFCRKDYRADGSLKTVVDFGSNIGLSAAYFLTRNATATVHLFEPDQRNVTKLRAQLARFEDRYTLHEAAVGVADGEVSFAHEPTGRYGGVRGTMTQAWVADAPTTTVRCVDADRTLRDIIAEHGEIDVLKMDIEGLEAPVLRHLQPETLRSVRCIYAETDSRQVELAGFARHQYGSIAVYQRIARMVKANTAVA